MGDDDHPAQLTALADGTLRGRRRKRLEAELEGSPELSEALAKQRRAIDALRAVEARAPAGLRARVEAERAAMRGGRASRAGERRGRGARAERRPARARTPGAWLRRPAFAGGLAAAAAFALLLALVLPGGAGGPSVVEAAELAALPAEAPAPRSDPAEPALLDARAEGLAFPDWAREFGWRASGRRVDEIDDRRAVTVFYEKEGRRIAYTIVSGDALDWPEDARRAPREGVDLRRLRSGDRTVVTWLRDGHTCVLSGEGTQAGTLLDLAAWKGQGAVRF
jgi:anti-sigma factor RsiW